MKILVTGVAGFIGSNLLDALLANKHDIVGIDNLNDFYDPKVKEKNLEIAKQYKNFKLYREDILDFTKIRLIFQKEKIDKVVHLAARAGVRASIKNPDFYAQVNVFGTVNLLKAAVDFKVKQFIFASSSSVYGNSSRLPFREDDPCDSIISPYGSAKRSAEFFVESFNRTYNLRCVILRLFTVYGPRGRPDMAPAIFTKAILEKKIIHQFGDGSSSRDYTYIDDLIEGIVSTVNSNFEFEIINLGSSNPIKLTEFISIIERLTYKKARVKKLLMQWGDVEKTWADISRAKKLINWQPRVSIDEGMRNYLNFIISLNA